MHSDETGSHSGSTISRKDADLDRAADDIHLLFQSYNDLVKQNSHKETTITDLTKQLQRSQEQEREAQHSIQQLHDMRDRLQSMLSKRCDLEDENKLLQSALGEKEKALEDERQKYETQLEEAQKKLEMVEGEHADEIGKLQSQAETQSESDHRRKQRGQTA
ncbi:uncharacterized protein [Amphiura filiformis]|uniref:uncharacterized protein n=1 Tax=Amphiura filiformis TaxID=82378 RepID=UPI003B21D958